MTSRLYANAIEINNSGVIKERWGWRREGE
jgi:hypothetical protein